MILPELAPPLFSVPFGNKCRGSRVLGFTRAAVASSRRVFATPNLQYGVILYVVGEDAVKQAAFLGSAYMARRRRF
jgi:hypothetical protein